MLDNIIEELKSIMSHDKRTFKNQITDKDWYYDEIYKALVILTKLSNKVNYYANRVNKLD